MRIKCYNIFSYLLGIMTEAKTVTCTAPVNIAVIKYCKYRKK